MIGSPNLPNAKMKLIGHNSERQITVNTSFHNSQTSSPVQTPLKDSKTCQANVWNRIWTMWTTSVKMLIKLLVLRLSTQESWIPVKNIPIIKVLSQPGQKRFFSYVYLTLILKNNSLRDHDCLWSLKWSWSGQKKKNLKLFCFIQEWKAHENENTSEWPWV